MTALAFLAAIALGAAGLSTLSLLASRALDAAATGAWSLCMRREALPPAAPLLLPAHEDAA